MAIPLRVALALALVAPQLGSCALFHPNGLARQSRDWVPKQRDPAEYAQSQMALGRDALNLQQFGLAIASFRAAQQFPEHAPDAYNGLGVAYANLGRPDLAARYFEMAMAARPADRRFAANLERLNASLTEQRLATAEAATPTGELAGTAPVRTLAGGITLDSATLPLRRISSSEVAIGAPVPARAQRAAVAANRGDGRRLNVNYPVRVAIGSAQRMAAADSAPPAGRRNPNYPVRITIDNPYAKPAGVTRLAR